MSPKTVFSLLYSISPELCLYLETWSRWLNANSFSLTWTSHTTLYRLCQKSNPSMRNRTLVKRFVFVFGVLLVRYWGYCALTFPFAGSVLPKHFFWTESSFKNLQNREILLHSSQPIVPQRIKRAKLVQYRPIAETRNLHKFKVH